MRRKFSQVRRVYGKRDKEFMTMRQHNFELRICKLCVIQTQNEQENEQSVDSVLVIK